MSNVWDYRECVRNYPGVHVDLDSDLLGYDVEATDGCLGKIVHVANGESGAYIVVDTCSCIPTGGGSFQPGWSGRSTTTTISCGSHSPEPRSGTLPTTTPASGTMKPTLRTQHSDYYNEHSR